jgi:hypothetical protein
VGIKTIQRPQGAFLLLLQGDYFRDLFPVGISLRFAGSTRSILVPFFVGVVSLMVKKTETIIRSKNTEIAVGKFLIIRHRGEVVTDIPVPKWAVRKLVKMKKEGKSDEIKRFLLQIFAEFAFNVDKEQTLF